MTATLLFSPSMQSRRVLVTGANGFIGSALTRRLLADGKLVRAAVRRADTVLPAGVEPTVTGDLSASTDWAAALADVGAVVHCAARAHVLQERACDPLAAFRSANRDATINLARQAVAGGVSRFVFLSSLGVNGSETFGRPFRAADQPSPASNYAMAKLEAELGLRAVARDTGLGLVVIRPPLVYGAQAPGNFARLLRVAKQAAPLPLGAIHNRRSFVFIDNLVDLLAHTLHHPDAPGRTLLVTDGHDLSTSDLLRRLTAAMGRPDRLLAVPGSWLRTAACWAGRPALGQRLCGSLQADMTDTEVALGWRPPVGVDAALLATAQQFLASSGLLGDAGTHNLA